MVIRAVGFPLCKALQNALSPIASLPLRQFRSIYYPLSTKLFFNSTKIGCPSPKYSAHRRLFSNNITTPWRIVNVGDNTKLLFFFDGDKLLYPVWTPLYGSDRDNLTRCFGISFGWLIIASQNYMVSNHLKLCLVNPRTGRRIQLPLYSPCSYLDDTKVILTSSPEHDRAIVVVKETKGYVSFCRLGDEDWTFKERYSESIILFNGVVYGTDYWQKTKIVTYKFKFSEGKKEICRQPFPLKRNKDFKKNGKYYPIHPSFLLESDGEFLFVVESFGSELGVFKLDFNTRSWVEVTSLGDRMLLLSHACSVSLDSKEFTKYGFRPNCIYFIKDHNDYAWQEFCLEDRKLVPFGVDFSTILPKPCLDFEFFYPKSDDFGQVKLLLQNYLDDREWNLYGFIDLILDKTTTATVVKSDGYEDDAVYAVVSALNFGECERNECIGQLREYLIGSCKNDDIKAKLKSLLQEQANDVGLLISQRFANCPNQLLPPLYVGLFDELSWKAEDDDSYFFKHYLLITRIYENTSGNKGKDGANSDIDEPFIYVKEEDEIFSELSSFSFTFHLNTEEFAPRVLSKSCRALGLAIVVKADRIPDFLRKLKSLYPRDRTSSISLRCWI